MGSQRQQLEGCLNQLETSLRTLGLWSAPAPAPSALASRLPFCADTLPFEYWLQWVFLPRMRRLLADQQPLPETSGLAPMAEISLRHLGRRQPIILEVLARIDSLLQSAQ